MQRIAAFIIHHRILVLILTAVLLLPMGYGLLHLEVEYDLLNYLPDDLGSVEGLRVLNKHFGFSSVAMVVVKSCPDWQVLQLKSEIESVDGVSSVYWLSDVADFSIPRTYQQQLVDQFYRKDATLLQVQFKEGGSSKRTQEAIRKIHSRLTGNQQLVGTVVTSAEMEEQSRREKTPMLLVSLLFITVVLFLTLPSFVTPLIFLITLGISVVFNLGLAHFMGGRISYITNSVAAALQLGVTMDYCIFLLHRFEEEQALRPNAEEAMIHAVKRTTVAILASSLTTVAGFATLGLMKVKIGGDLGFTMARGVVIALVGTVTVLPALIIVSLPLIKRLRHRSLFPSFAPLGRAVSRFHIPLFVIMLLLTVPAFYGKTKLDVSFDLERSFPESLPSMKATKQLREEYGVADTANIITNHLPAWQTMAIEQAVAKIPGIEGASSLYSLVGSGIPEAFIPTAIRDRFSASRYDNIYLTLTRRATDPLSAEAFERIRSVLKQSGYNAYLTGQTVVDYDMKRLSQADMKLIDWLSLLAIGIIVAISFRSIGIPVLLVFVIQVAIWANQSMVFYTGGSLYFFSALALSTIQLGATVDYAILVTSRFKEERSEYPAPVAISRAVAECAGALFTSGLTLCAATIGIYLVSSLNLVKDLAMLLARGAIISMVASTVLLPAALLLLERVIAWTSFRWPSDAKNVLKGEARCNEFTSR